MGEKNPDIFLSWLRITFYFFLDLLPNHFFLERRFTAKYFFFDLLPNHFFLERRFEPKYFFFTKPIWPQIIFFRKTIWAQILFFYKVDLTPNTLFFLLWFDAKLFFIHSSFTITLPPIHRRFYSRNIILQEKYRVFLSPFYFNLDQNFYFFPIK